MSKQKLGDLIEGKVFDFLYGKDTTPRIYSNSMVLVFAKEYPHDYERIVKECEEILKSESEDGYF